MAVHQRTCIGCHQVKARENLIRIVRSSAEKTVTVDLHWKGKGRGAYICYDISCIDRAMQPEILNRAFRIAHDSTDSIKLETIGELKQNLLSLIEAIYC